jgi:hypothetical protein
MSEVDRLSNSGLYPALPIGDKRRSRDQSSARKPSDQAKQPTTVPAAESEQTGTDRLPKSRIDEYA